MRALMKERQPDMAAVPLVRRDDQPRRVAKTKEIAVLKERFGQSDHREQVADAIARGQKPTTPIADQAKALLDGATIVSLPPEAERAAAQQEKAVLHAAIVAKNEELAAVDSELSYEACKSFAHANAAAYRQVLAAVEALHQALEVTRVIRGRLVGAGYSLNETALPIHLFPHAAVLGDPDRVGMTPAALFKQWCRDKGII